MADDAVVNGEGETFYDDTEEMNRKVEVLEKEKLKLAAENDEAKETVEKMKIEIEELNRRESETKAKLKEMAAEIERLEDATKVTAAIATRAAGLETEASRLQHDLIQAMSEAEEANSELYSLKKVLAERAATIEALESEVESLKAAKAESDENLSVMEAREKEGKNKRVQAEEDARESIREKENEIAIFKKTIEALRSEVEILEAAKSDREESMKREAEDLASEMAGLQKVGTELLGIKNLINEEDEENHRSNIRWPVVAGSAGVVVAGAAVVCVLYNRRH